MGTDDLHKPLAMRASGAPGRSVLRPQVVGAAMAGFVVLACAGLILVRGHSLGGEPHQIARIDRSIVTGSTAAPKVSPPAAAANPGRETAQESEDVAGVRVIRGNGTAPNSVIITVPPQEGATQIASLDRRMSERARHGLLPRIDPVAGAPRDVYARPFNAAQSRGKPQIAILVTGLGIGQSATADAITKLPGEVSFAFAPYGQDLERMTQRARDAGHELLLQAPMEPHGYPQNDSGPHTLLAEASEAQNLDKLHWVMSRFQGYVGIANFMGAKFLGVRPALKPVLDEISRRGLLFIEDGATPRSLVSEVASTSGLPAGRGTVLLDGLDKGPEFEAALARAEASARAGTPVIVIGPALPTTIDRLSRWARTLESKGIVLTPVSALVGRKAG